MSTRVSPFLKPNDSWNQAMRAFTRKELPIHTLENKLFWWVNTGPNARSRPGGCHWTWRAARLSKARPVISAEGG
jgi:hypothetical protein